MNKQASHGIKLFMSHRIGFHAAGPSSDGTAWANSFPCSSGHWVGPSLQGRKQNQ